MFSQKKKVFTPKCLLYLTDRHILCFETLLALKDLEHHYAWFNGLWNFALCSCMLPFHCSYKCNYKHTQINMTIVQSHILKGFNAIWAI